MACVVAAAVDHRKALRLLERDGAVHCKRHVDLAALSGNAVLREVDQALFSKSIGLQTANDPPHIGLVPIKELAEGLALVDAGLNLLQGVRP